MYGAMAVAWILCELSIVSPSSIAKVQCHGRQEVMLCLLVLEDWCLRDKYLRDRATTPSLLRHVYT